jgi:hypothetical protein
MAAAAVEAIPAVVTPVVAAATAAGTTKQIPSQIIRQPRAPRNWGCGASRPAQCEISVNLGGGDMQKRIRSRSVS